MKKIYMRIAALAALFGSPALAADMVLKAPAAPAWSWTGWYVGGNLGGAWGRSTWCTDATIISCATAAPVDVNTENPAGVVGGAQAGARWQAPNKFVLGAEVMFDGMHISQTIADSVIAALGFPGRTRTMTFDNLYSVTGQLGYAWDRVLLYGKGGWAGTRLGVDANNTNPGGFDLNSAATIGGYAAGAGLEYALTHNLSLAIEYGFYGFKLGNITNVTNSGGVLIGCAFCNFSNINVQTVTARVNWRFDWLVGPIATK